MLLLAEKEQNVTTHSISWLKVERKQDVEAGTDAFNVSVKTPMKFKCVKKDEAENAQTWTCKNVFSKLVPKIADCTVIGKSFRFRFERVGGSFKVQRPYVITQKSISLEKGKPLKISP